MEFDSLYEIWEVFKERPEMFAYLFIGLIAFKWLFKTIRLFVVFGALLIAGIYFFN